MSTAALAFLTAAALVTSLVVAVRARRTNREARAAFSRGLLEMSQRLEALDGELAEAVEKARKESVRAQILESLAGTLDLDEVLMRCAEAAALLPGVAAAAVTVEIDGTPLVAAVGLDPETIGPTVGPPGGVAVRAVGVSYHYREGSVEEEQMLSAIAVPIESHEGRLGFLTVFGRDEEPPVAGAEFQTLEAIAHHARPAIEKARALQQRATQATDAVTGLASREALHETLALEASRAHRGGYSLAVCVLEIDDLSVASIRQGQPVADRVLDQVAALLRETLRPEGRVFRCGADALAVVLRSSGRIEAEATVAQARTSLKRLPHPLGFLPSVSAGIAELKPDDDGVSLFERAERALRHARQQNSEGQGSGEAGALPF